MREVQLIDVSRSAITFLDRAAAVFNLWLLERGFVGLQQDKMISQGR
ncbi:hypothetical protein [Nostoc favosum]|nr:hypothetical protein [Nostoc favosum]